MAKNAKSKFYVVWDGVNPGIYDNWKEAQAQVQGYPNARYKSYPTLKEAEDAFHSGYPVASRSRDQKKKTKKQGNTPGTSSIVWDSISVDAACSGNPGVMEYRGVRTATGEVLFHQGPFPEGTNNIGEFLALVHGLAMLGKQNDPDTPIYSDSRIAIGWVNRGKAKTRLERNKRTEVLFHLIKRAEDWLKTHRWKNQILKWETEDWGEIPADFGRK